MTWHHLRYCIWIHYISHQGWGLLKLCSLIYLSEKYFILQHYMLHTYILQNGIHIWQVSPQLSCGDTCQIWLSYAIPNMCFENGEKLGKNNKIEEIILVTPTHSSYTRNKNALSVLHAMLVFLLAVCTRDSPCDKDCCKSVFVMNYYRGRSWWWASVFVMNYYSGRSWWWASVFVMNYYRGRSGWWAYLGRLFQVCIIHPKNMGWVHTLLCSVVYDEKEEDGEGDGDDDDEEEEEEEEEEDGKRCPWVAMIWL